jgi:hypothetical protein
MKFQHKGMILGLLFMSAAVASWAQPTITLLTFESYTFADQFDTEYGPGKISDGFQWGLGIEVMAKENSAFELIYQNIKTDAYYTGWYNNGERRFEGTVGINYAMVGGTRYKPFNEKVSGFGSFDLGAAWMNPSSSLESSSVTKFAWGGRLGVRISTSEKISLRLHAQVLSPVQWAGGGVYFGSGGTGAGVSTGSTIYQFNLGGSVNIKLK